ncbi:MAG: hypothetical protein HXY24_09125 [Rubrivivax sp.]|nr:hypothetical protein [Rubrivivax sp.]
MTPATDRPQPKLGDQWQFVTRLVGGSTPLVLDHMVRELRLDGGWAIGVRKAGTDEPWLTQVFDAEFNRVAREVVPGESMRYSPAFPLFRFPIEPGRRWKAAVEQRQDGEPGHRIVEVDARVVGAEAVEVPAGRFDAWRIEAVHRAGDVRIDTVYWFAPRAKRSVRGVETSRSPRGTSELIYELQSLRLV